ncbi:MAG: phosphoribosyl-AMP cyclohydrolase [Candidatus Omnitrophica bacterium]|nr:phosphoribosyl-AMP cyclohydrolase [Candidatus Omnitrophota bacterium]
MDDVKFDAKGLIPAVVEDAKTHQVLMMAWMNRQALMKTLKTKKTHFYSRSRRRMWLKGESSGHIQKVKRIALDCDGDVLLVSVSQTGGACHTGYRSCFFRTLKSGKWLVRGKRIFDPDAVYGRLLRRIRSSQ